MTLPSVSLPGSGHAYYVLDVFTDTPLAGNQLAVFPDGSPFSTDQMHEITREMNLAETVFLLPPAEPGADVRMRIFTPGAELPFAGHPVLGAAVYVGSALRKEAVVLQTGLGAIPVELKDLGARAVHGTMLQRVPPWEPYARAAELLAALGVRASLLPIESYRNGPLHVFVCLGSAEEVAALRPNSAALAEHGDIGANVFSVSGTSVKTRMFGSGIGITEDPATGSAAGPLAIHLARHRVIEWGAQIEITQGVEILRPSTLYARATGSADAIERIEVSGRAVLVAQGSLHL